MNIFFLSLVPSLAAKWHCDKHVVKMILEAVQVLYSVHWLRREDKDWIKDAPKSPDGSHGYKKTHVSHPPVLWATESEANYKWLCSLAANLHEQYQLRYGYNKIHSSFHHLQWLEKNIPPFMDTEKEFTTPKLSITPEYNKYAQENNLDPVAAYQYYYRKTKISFLSYRNVEIPPFLSDLFTDEENYVRLGLSDSTAINVVRASYKKENLENDTRLAYGIDSLEKETLLLEAVASRHDSPRKWSECARNGTRITNAVKRAVGPNSPKFTTIFDKERKATKKRVPPCSPEELNPSPKKVQAVPVVISLL